MPNKIGEGQGYLTGLPSMGGREIDSLQVKTNVLGNLFSRCINITPIPKRSWQYFFKYSLPLSQKKIPVGLYLRRCLQAIFFAKLPTTKDKHHVTTPSLRFFWKNSVFMYVFRSFFLSVCLCLSSFLMKQC